MLRVVAVAALLVAGACGGSTDYGSSPPPAPPPGPPPPPPPPPPAPGPTVSVSVTDDLFTPSNGSVLSGGTATWDWGGGTGSSHNVTFEDGQGSSTNKTSGTHQRTFPTVTSATTFRYRCTNHSSSFTSGMVGQIVVAP